MPPCHAKHEPWQIKKLWPDPIYGINGITLMMSSELRQLMPAEEMALYIAWTMPGHLWLLETAEAASVAGQLSAAGIRQLRQPVTGYGFLCPAPGWNSAQV